MYCAVYQQAEKLRRGTNLLGGMEVWNCNFEYYIAGMA
jgi:hypothetical protein